MLENESSCCGDHTKKKRIDILFWIGLIGVAIGYFVHLAIAPSGWLGMFSHSVFRLMNQMWIGLALGILALGFLGKVPQKIVQGAMGREGSFSGILRACFAGLFLDLCNHGILMVAAKLYERGVSYGQVLAFLIASPWNSLSLTLILFSLIGFKWTLLFIVGSAVVAIFTGLLASLLVKRTSLPENPNTIVFDDNYSFKSEVKKSWSEAILDRKFFSSALINGVRESRMIVRWLLLGTLLAACLTTFVPPDAFSKYFGPTVLGLMVTLVGASIIEVCSEGSVPIAAELLNTANAPGNSFTFLMAGAATDYTEIAILKEATGSWKLTFLLPLLALPQIVVLGLLFNSMS
jgi:uncharacterized membrane protein YraQ (UPF0718 family)